MSINDLNNNNLSQLGSSANTDSEGATRGLSPVLSPANMQNSVSPNQAFSQAPAQEVQTTQATQTVLAAQPTLAPQTTPIMQAPQAMQSQQTAAAQKSPSSEKKSKGGARIAALAVSFSLIGALAGGTAVAFLARNWSNQAKEEAIAAARRIARNEDGDNSGESGDKSSSDKGQSNVLQGNREYTTINTANVDTNQKHTAAEIYAANVNSTVGITTSIDYNYYGYKTTAAASGSGFIFSDDGYIVTNYHVVEGSSSIKVTTYDGHTYDAEFIGYDESNDLAVLKIDAEGLVPVILGDSDKMNVGDDVLAIGNPLGELTFSLTAGCISALNREVTIEKTRMNLIQTDCAINSGNSGGALFNLYGEVIGITNAKYSNAGAQGEASIENIGFAIPMNSVKDIITDIIETGFITKPYIGISCQAVSNRMQSYGLPEGISIEEIIPDGPADKAGLQVNDIITEINGKAIPTTDALRAAIDSCGIGGKMKIKVFRQGDYVDIDLTVEEQKAPSTQSSKKG